MKKTVCILSLLLALLLTGCTGERQRVQPIKGSYSAQEPLLALVKSREEAEKLAEVYGIELVSCADGVASFFTEQEPAELIRLGKERGLPELNINYLNTAEGR